MFYSVISSRFSHPISSAIFANVCRSGWCMLVHHLLTVTAETPNCSASHLLVFWFSTRTTFSRLRGFSLIFIKLKSSANIIKVGDITKRIFKKLHLSAFLPLFHVPSTSLAPPLQRRTIFESSMNHHRGYKLGLCSVYATPMLRYSLDIPTIALHYPHDSPLLYEVAFPPSISLPCPFHLPSTSLATPLLLSCYKIP